MRFSALRLPVQVWRLRILYTLELPKRLSGLSSVTCQARAGVLHRYRDGESAISGFADDYAYLVAALIALYEATFDPAYLSRALALNATFITHFEDRENGGFFTTSESAEKLLVRKKEWYDGAVPSANAIAFENLSWLARVTEDKNIEEASIACSRFLAGAAERAPVATAAFLAGLTRLPPAGNTQDLVIAGDPAQPDTRALLNAACDQYLPGLIVLLRPPGKAGDDLESLAPVVRGRSPINGHAAAYLCTSHSCRAPVHDPGRTGTNAQQIKKWQRTDRKILKKQSKQKNHMFFRATRSRTPTSFQTSDRSSSAIFAGGSAGE